MTTTADEPMSLKVIRQALKVKANDPLWADVCEWLRIELQTFDANRENYPGWTPRANLPAVLVSWVAIS